MKSDIEIAREAKMQHITEVAKKIDIEEGDLELYGKYKAKLSDELIDKDRASIGMLQRYLKVGFNRAARIMDQLSEAGIVGPEEGTKPRKVLMSPEEFETFLEENG